MDVSRAAWHGDLVVGRIRQGDQFRHARDLAAHVGYEDQDVRPAREHVLEVPSDGVDVGQSVDGRVEPDVPLGVRQTQADERGHVLSHGCPDHGRHGAPAQAGCQSTQVGRWAVARKSLRAAARTSGWTPAPAG